MTTVYLNADSYTEVTRARDYEDRWSGEDTSTTWNFGGISLDADKKGFWESYETDFDVQEGDEIHLVVAVWSSGDSFSRNDGVYCEVFGAYKDFAEAEARKDYLYGLKENPKRKKGKPVEYYPWFGYFDSLDYIEIVSGKVK